MQYLRTLRCRGNDTLEKYLSELKRACFAQETVKRTPISESEIAVLQMQPEVPIVPAIVQTVKLYIGKGHNFIQVCRGGRCW